MSQTVELRAAQRKLAGVWFTGAGLLTLLIVVQSILGKFGAAADKAWGWYLPSILPSLSLIVGAVAYRAVRPAEESERVDRLAFRISYGLSIFYLALVSTTLLLEPFSTLTPIELMDLSNLWLAPLQGLTAAALAVFFQTQTK